MRQYAGRCIRILKWIFTISPADLHNIDIDMAPVMQNNICPRDHSRTIVDVDGTGDGTSSVRST